MNARTRTAAVLSSVLLLAPALSGVSAQAVSTSSTPAATAAPTRADARVLSGSFTSRYWRGQHVNWRAALPSSGRPRATVVVLHGKGDNAAYAFDNLDLRAQADRTGFALVAVDGGNSYWHADGQGNDAGFMVMKELLPTLGSRGLPTQRIGLTGYSMGGLGSLVIAQRLGPKRVFAVAPMSAAIHDEGHHAGGAEMAAQKFLRKYTHYLRPLSISMVCGTNDHLLGSNQAFARRIPGGARTHYSPGGHDMSYWKPALARQLTWMSTKAPRR